MRVRRGYAGGSQAPVRDGEEALLLSGMEEAERGLENDNSLLEEQLEQLGETLHKLQGEL